MSFKVSVIIPVYNSERYIERTLNSIINQTFSNIEIICVDDGSNDTSLEILRQYESKYQQISVYTQQNSGVSAARNLGIDKSTGDFIMFVDSDDWIDVETIDKVIEIIENNNCYDVVMFAYTRERNGESSPKKTFMNDKNFTTEKEINYLRKRIVGLRGKELQQPDYLDALGPVWSKLYKREIIYSHNIKFVDLKYIGTAEDVLFNIEYFSFIDKAYYLALPSYHYFRDNDSSTTSKYKENYVNQRKKFFELIRTKSGNERLDVEYEQALTNRIALSSLEIGLNELLSSSNEVIKISNIQKYLKDKTYQESVRKLPLKYFPYYWKIFYLFSKYKFGMGVYLMLQLINLIRKKR